MPEEPQSAASQSHQTPAETRAPIEIQAPARPQAAPSLMQTIALIMRLVTLACLIVSTSVMASDSARIGARSTIHFNDIYSYRYVVATSVIGLAYTLLQLSFLIHEVLTVKRISNHQKLAIFEFIADKVIVCLLATGVGAAFGATLDLKVKIDELDDALEDVGVTGFSSSRARIDDFLNRAYIPTIFLLIAVLTSTVSSVLSSLALTKKTL